ncbi:hypothetical protein QBC42DRAFT_348150 [Cladorrhinum samala]|uniref:Uncharacterized protein n=1 Tax=Cladorrhinum samala TaxID=585594 RepID=A0AAV9HJF4_9PEZI|nr:hypothetical protein QBC42DRAFT_348150 [Cladorrhinum samala]
MSDTKDKVKDVFKRGWHPEKAGTTLKGQMKSLVGRGEERNQSNHVARPLATLRDPAEFAPPPKRRSDTINSAHSVSSPVAHAPPQAEPEQDDEPPPPPKPWRLNTTGLSTDNLPPPPGRRDGADGRILSPPPPYKPASRPIPAPPPRQASGTPPSLPPRLPPRSGSSSSPAPTPISTITSASGTTLNQSAISRLGAAGISVPALGIGSSQPPTSSSSSSSSARPPPPPPPSASSNSAVSELQSRFARLKSNSHQPRESDPATTATTTTTNSSTENGGAGAGGTTWAQKQAALKTASDLHRDPSKVSFSEVKAAASTAENFRQRHGDQVAKAGKFAGGLYGKYGGGGQQQDRGDAGVATAGQESGSGSGGGVAGIAAAAVAKKKPPPPPPPKKKNNIGGGGEEGAPPPVPMATRPQF